MISERVLNVIAWIVVCAALFGIVVVISLMCGGCTAATNSQSQLANSKEAMVPRATVIAVIPKAPRSVQVPLVIPDSATNVRNWEIQESHDMKVWWPIWHTCYGSFVCVWATNQAGSANIPTYWRALAR